MRPFWWGWPSWAVELTSGAALQTGLWAYNPQHGWLLRLAAGLVVSGLYEWGLDRHGWNWRDVGQRAVGQGGFELVRWVLR